jgi:hypothetical protein
LPTQDIAIAQQVVTMPPILSRRSIAIAQHNPQRVEPETPQQPDAHVSIANPDPGAEGARLRASPRISLQEREAVEAGHHQVRDDGSDASRRAAPAAVAARGDRTVEQPGVGRMIT